MKEQRPDVDYILNSEYLFFFDKQHIKYFNLKKDFTDSNLKDLGFNVDINE